MTSHPQRQQLVQWIEEARVAGARQRRACEEIGISVRTLQRWRDDDGKVRADGRPTAQRPKPSNALSDEERERIVSTCNQPEFAHLPPSQIVPKLADQGVFLASESTVYRVLKAANQSHHRGRAKAPQKRKTPTTHTAKAANQVWSWDISYLPTQVRGCFYYLYLILDIYSRKIVGWEIHEREGGDEAAELVHQTVIAERCFREPVVLHADNGAPMTSQTFKAKLADLGIKASHSRPRVSNDNPFSEAMFRTLKYCPQWPSQGFADLTEAREWMAKFVHAYNEEHQHSQIRYVTPAQRHRGEDKALLEQRERVYEAAKAKHPNRWSGKTRNWSQIGPVTLNPERLDEELRQAA